MTSFHDNPYLDLVEYVLENGTRKPNRTGVDTIGVFSYQMRFNLRDGTIPVLTTKKMHLRSIIHEILWYLQGADNIKYLKDNNVTIWDEWADAEGNLGPVYGYQWRRWPTYTFIPGHAMGYEWVEDSYEVGHIDQIAMIVDKLRNNPLDRRLIVSAWNVADIGKMALPPCHYTFQFYVRPRSAVEMQADGPNSPKYELSLMLNQRSCDIGLGVPFNIAQYSILLRMFCEVANMTPGEFIWNGGDTHVYVNHIDALKEQLTRLPHPSPRFGFARKVAEINDFKYEDFVLDKYASWPSLKMDVAV